MTEVGKAIKEGYQWEVRSQWRGAPLKGSIRVSIRFFFQTKRRRDLDNQNKLVLDALTGIAYEDDSQIDELHLCRSYDKERPRIEIKLESIR